ncbi:cysteine-rich PDZ-binding protein [Trifolium repens]|nr:cysteine-rich PDZ-binding protein [Trifolium repens]
MVCEKCQKKLSKEIVPNKWKEGASNTIEGGGRKINENKLLSKNSRPEHVSNFVDAESFFGPISYEESTMEKDRKVIKSKRAQEKKKKKKMKIQQDSESKKKPQKMKASTSAPVRVNYQTRSKSKQQESSSESEWDSDWKEFLSTYVPPSEEYPSS